MNPKEKAKKLIIQYRCQIEWVTPTEVGIDIDTVKNCAFIAIDEVLILINNRVNEWSGWTEEKQYWEDVKEEVKNYNQ